MTTADRHALTLLAADALADTMPPEDLLDAVGELDDLTDDEFAALFDDRPATFGDLAARPAPVSLPVAFAEYILTQSRTGGPKAVAPGQEPLYGEAAVAATQGGGTAGEPKQESSPSESPEADKPSKESATVFAGHVRDAVESLSDGDTKDWCNTVSEAIKSIVPEAEIWTGPYAGDEYQSHTIVKVKDHFIDVTADQFGGPKIVVTDRLDGVYAEFTKSRWQDEKPAEQGKKIAAMIRGAAAIATAPKAFSEQPCPVSLPVVFSEAPADKQFSLPGPAGERAYNLMAHLRAEGTRTLYRLAERAVSRLVADPAAAQSAYTLFDDDELAELKQSLAATVAAADMLGRARIAQLAAMKQKAKTFAEYTLTQSRTGGPKAVAPGKPPLYGDDAIAAAKGEKQPAELPASVPAELRRPDIPDTEDVDIHSGGDVFWSGSHANAKALVNEAFKQDGPAGVAGLEIRRKGAGEVRKSQQAAPAPVKAEPLPPPSDYASFETGTPLRATVFRGETRGGSGTGMAAMGHGKYYGLEPAVAERFSVPESVKATTVELKNPVVIKSDDDMVAIKKAAEKATGFDFGRDGNLYEGFLHGDQPAKFTAALIRMGYDGLLTTYAGAPGGQQLLVFPPKTFSEWYFPKQSHRSFAEGDEFAAFAEPVPPRPPLEALDYFRKLVPSLDNDPLRYGPLLDRHAFTLAYATDQTMLESVKRALLANLAGQTESANLIAGLEGERNVRGAELVQSILDRAGVSPRNPQYCFLPGTMVEGAVLAASKANYDGPAVKIETHDGRVLAVTVNHPVLTAAGWKAAGELQESDELLGYGPAVEPLAYDTCLTSATSPKGRAVHDQNVPARIEDVFETLFTQRRPGLDVKCPVGPLDFHGDAVFMQGEIDCVGADGVLPSAGDAACGQCGGKRVLMHGLVDTAEPTGGGGGLLNTSVEATLYASLVADELAENTAASAFVASFPPVPHVVGMAAKLDPSRFKAVAKTPGGDAQLYRHLVEALPSQVTTLRILKIERIRWTGHVYNLSTTTGFIVSQGIITSNCEMVYRTNTLDAYHQGMQRELAKPEVQEMFPAWRYLGIKDGREGDDHRPNFGRVYPVTMPFTEARGPRPWNCRCSSQPLDKDELKLFIDAGGVVETTPQYGRG